MKKLLIMALLCLVASVGVAQKKNVNIVLGESKSENPNYGEAEKLIKEAMQNDETKSDVKTWYAAGQLMFSRFDKEKMKLMLNQPDKVDNNVMYNSLYESFIYFKKAFILDIIPNEKGKVKARYSKEMGEIIIDNKAYLINGAGAMYDKKEYNNAYKYLTAYLSIPSWPYFKANHNNMAATDTLYFQMKEFRAGMATLMEDKKFAIEAYTELIQDTRATAEHFQNLNYLYTQEKDTTAMFGLMETAIKRFPNNSYFVQNLINLYIGKNKYQEAINYLDIAIGQDPTSAQYWDVKGNLYESMKDISAAKKSYEKAIEINPNYAESQFNMGRLIYNDAITENDRINNLSNKEYQVAKGAVKIMFEKALPYMEKAVQLEPTERKYIIPLRSIYYNTNRTAEYEKLTKQLEE